MKIAVYSICKNEESFVERFLKSCAHADLVVVADTGSSDNTINEFTKQQAGVVPIALHQVSINPWRFDTARNVSLALVPADIDVCVRLDLDEVLDPGWRPALEDAWVEGTTQLWYWFRHAPGYRFRANYIHARHGFHWKYADHEGLYDVSGHSRPRIADDRLSITHLQDPSKDRTSILPRLIKSAKEDECARTLYYLGREFYYYRQNREALGAFLLYLEREDSTWVQERMDVMYMMAECHERLGEILNAHHWWHRAIAEYSTTREPYLGLALFAERQGLKSLAAGLARHALTITYRMDSMFNKPAAWDGTLEQIAQRCQ